MEMSAPAKSYVFTRSLVAILGLLNFTGFSQSECDGYRYRYTGAFGGFDVQSNVVYGENILNFTPVDLDVDVYTPTGDTEANRPLVVIAHGGFFLFGSNDGADVVPLCEDLASMGYVVASMSYRLIPQQVLPTAFASGTLPDEFVKAVWRGVHDSRAAVRYFRKSAEEMGNPFGVDTNRIYLGGVSAGGFIALHHAYVDMQSEIPAEIDVTEEGMGGGLEGLSGNTGYSSEVNGIFNIAGALQTTDFLNAGTNEPLFSIHGTEDETVPYGEGSIFVSLPDIPGLEVELIDVDGSSVVHEAAEAMGMDNCLITVEGAGHVPHILSPENYDLTLSALAGKLGEWACEDYVQVCGGYDYTAETGTSKVELNDDGVKVFPNPTSSSHGVQIVFPSTSQWQVLNVFGQIVDEGLSVSNSQVHLTELSPGWYVVQTPKSRVPFVVAN